MTNEARHMKAVVLDGTVAVREVEKPRRSAGEVLLRVETAGICGTDHEIMRGYVPGFRGTLGHEFLGRIEEAEDPSLCGRRATAEINAACGACAMCRRGLQRHCPLRSVLGIRGSRGAFAEYLAVPADTVVTIPDAIPDTSAVFIEPLAAACEVLEQVPVTSGDSVLLIGDGKLAALIAIVLNETGCRLTVVGRHVNKLAIISGFGIRHTALAGTFVNGQHDVVVEASGNPDVLVMAIANTRPRGTLVLKSTYGREVSINPSPIVVNEITIVGSRCGRFSEAIAFLLAHAPALDRLVTAEFPLDRALDALDRAAEPEALKVLLRISSR